MWLPFLVVLRSGLSLALFARIGQPSLQQQQTCSSLVCTQLVKWTSYSQALSYISMVNQIAPTLLQSEHIIWDHQLSKKLPKESFLFVSIAAPYCAKCFWHLQMKRKNSRKGFLPTCPGDVLSTERQLLTCSAHLDPSPLLENAMVAQQTPNNE